MISKKQVYFSPVDFVFQIYNLSVFIFVAFHLRQINNGVLLLIIHIGIAALMGGVMVWRGRIESDIWQALNVILPLVLLTILHYETGLINLTVFDHYFDHAIERLDLLIFGTEPIAYVSQLINSRFLQQIFHFFYFTFYLVFFLPLLRLFFKEKQQYTSRPGTDTLWPQLAKTQQMLFTLLFTMFICYWIFILFPVVGPTREHSLLYSHNRGMVGLINLIYQYADTDGGAMPSSHVAATLVVTLFCFKYLRNIRWIMLADFILLSISAVYCSFHYAVDVLAGLFMGLSTYFAGNYLFARLYNPAAESDT